MTGVGVVAIVVHKKVHDLFVVLQVGVAVPFRDVAETPSVTRPVVEDFPTDHGLARWVQRCKDGGVGGALGELEGWGRL